MKLNRSTYHLPYLSLQRLRVSSTQVHKTETSQLRHTYKVLPLLFPACRSSTISTKNITVMASDEAYSSFLDKANQPTGAGTTSSSRSQPENQQDLVYQSSNIPPVLKSLNVTLTSESDEPFEPFTVSYPGSALPNASEFARTIKHEKGESGVEEVTVKDFDPREEYKNVVNAVSEAAAGGEDGNVKGEVRCFRAAGAKGTEVVYYVVGLDREGKRLVGVRAVSVES